MEFDKRVDKVQGLEAIKERAIGMASQGADALEVRNFIADAKQELAFELPATEKYKKSKEAASKFKSMRG